MLYIKQVLSVATCLALCSCFVQDSDTNVVVPNPTIAEISKPSTVRYAWAYQSAAKSLNNQVLVPDGYSRIAVKKGSFQEWLRHLPMQPKGTKIKLYNGKTKFLQALNGGVVDVDVGTTDLQQCADAVMRLRAEYLYSQQRYNEIHFNYTSGFKAEYSKWRNGNKIKVRGNSVSYYQNSKSTDKTYAGFKQYLKNVYMYAGTFSLNKELKKESISNLKAGDVFIIGGFPGHVVMVAGVCKNNAGEQKVLLVQSYMPAQNIHVVKPSITSGKNCWHSIKQLKAKGWKNLEFDYDVSHYKTWGN